MIQILIEYSFHTNRYRLLNKYGHKFYISCVKHMYSFHTDTYKLLNKYDYNSDIKIDPSHILQKGKKHTCIICTFEKKN